MADLLRFEDTEGPDAPLDELTRRRWVEQVLKRAESAGRAEEPRRAPVGRIWILAGAGVAAAAVALILVLWRLQLPEEPTASFADATGSRFLLVSGEVLLEGVRVADFQPFEEGEHIAVQSGRAVLGLGDRIKVDVEAGSELRLGRLRHDGIEIALEQGDLLASVSPGSSPQTLSLITPAGRLEVLGTVFSVRARRGSVDLVVIRGSVRVVEPGVEPRKVGGSQAITLGKPDVRPVSRTEEKEARTRTRPMGILTPTQAMTIVIDSDPTGASVQLDGTVLGITPLSASVVAGSHEIELVMPGRNRVVESLSADPGVRIARVFNLEEIHETEPDPAPRRLPPDKRLSRKKLVKATPRAEPPVAVPDAPVPPPEPPPTPGMLLADARELRSARLWNDAAKLYRRLIEEHAGTSEARSAMVSLGELLLDHLDRPAEALRLFEAYLAFSEKGTLAQEAAFGRIQALEALGRSSEELQAIKDFLERYPLAIQARQVKTMLRRLEKSRRGL